MDGRVPASDSYQGEDFRTLGVPQTISCFLPCVAMRRAVCLRCAFLSCRARVEGLSGSWTPWSCCNSSNSAQVGDPNRPSYYLQWGHWVLMSGTPPPQQGGWHGGTGKGSQGVALSPPLLLSQEGESLGHRPADSASAEDGFPYVTGSQGKKPDLRLGDHWLQKRVEP